MSHKQFRVGFLKNDASPGSLGHWLRNLDSLKNIIKNLCFYVLINILYLYVDLRPKKVSKTKFGAEFEAIITDFGEAARQKSFLRIHLSAFIQSLCIRCR